MKTPIVALLVALAIGGAIGFQLDRWHADYHRAEEQLRLRCLKASPEYLEFHHCGG